MFGCLIQGNTPNGTWGPAWIERGIGGSEQAAIYLAAALQRGGWQVEVYGAYLHVVLVSYMMSTSIVFVSDMHVAH